jgi:glycerol uptake facilitator-like aquaporin
MPKASLGQRLLAEALGTAALLAVVVGSGIMGERLSGGNVAIALLANTLATGAALVVLILALGPISGAHLNPAVTLVELAGRRLPARDAALYLGAQFAGAVLGVWLAHAMFDVELWMLSTKVRAGPAQLLSEVVATFGLVLVIATVSRSRPTAVPLAVGLYISSAYWFTASTSFANPAVTLARSLTDTFAGIRPADVPGFVVAQALGAALAVVAGRLLLPRSDA